MALEKRWLAVSAQAFLVSGTTNGVAEVSDACLFKVKQKVQVSDGSNVLNLEVKRVNSGTELELGEAGKDIRHRVDLSSFPPGSTVSAEEQPRPSIPPDDTLQAAFSEEPTVAYRNVLVDRCGDYVTPDNPLPIEGDIQVTLESNVDELSIFNVNVPNKDTEVSLPIPNETKRLEFHCRGRSRLQWTFTSSESDVTYWTLKPGNTEIIDGVKLESKTLYFQTSNDNEVLEVRAWT
jgi:hypothetical protein